MEKVQLITYVHTLNTSNTYPNCWNTTLNVILCCVLGLILPIFYSPRAIYESTINQSTHREVHLVTDDNVSRQTAANVYCPVFTTPSH